MEYRREIDGLRAVAVLPVILFHAGFQTFSGGYVGVDVFFVISGYLITSIILAEKRAGTFTLINFYERRTRRILPALFVVMFACLPLAWLWLWPADMKSFSQSLTAVSGFASNILFWRTSGYFETAAELKPLLHTWSLAVEEQYYLLFPLFLILTWRLGKRWILSLLVAAAAGSLALAQLGSTYWPAATFYLLPTRGWELLIGAFVAFYLSSYPKPTFSQYVSQFGGAIGLLLVAYAVFVFDKQTPFPSLYALAPTAGTALIILFATRQTLVGKLLGNQLLVGLGLISYSTYLWHHPLFAFARHKSFDPPGKCLLATLAVAAVVLAYFSWRFVETPFRQKNRFSRKQIFIYGAIGSVLLASFGMLGHLTNGDFFRRYDEVITRIEAVKKESGKNESCWNLIASTKNLSNTCQLGVPDSSKSFVIVGDSHAGALTDELNSAAKAANLGGNDFSYNACPPLYKGLAGKQDAVQAVCNGLRDDFFKKLQSNHLPKTLILVARWTMYLEQNPFDNKEGGVESGGRASWHAPDFDRLGYIPALRKNYSESVKLMLDAGHKIILVYPIPEMGWDVPTRLSNIFAQHRALSSYDASTSHQVFIERNARTYEALDTIGEHENLVRIRPEKILCDTFAKNRCVAVLGGAPLYYDDDHLSNAGARLIVAEIMKHLIR